MMYGPGQAGLTLGVSGTIGPIPGSRADLSLGVGVGITDRVTFDASLGTLSLAPSVRYAHPEVGVWFGLVDRPALEVDATTHLTFGFGDERTPHEVEPGAVVILRMGDRARIDAGAYVPVSMEREAAAGLRAPLALAVQIHPYLHVALSSGVTIPRLADGRVTVPLGLTLGCTLPLPGGGYIVVAPSLSWPRLVRPAGDGISGPGPMVIGASVSIITPS
jgi:hypothetical protein